MQMPHAGARNPPKKTKNPQPVLGFTEAKKNKGQTVESPNKTSLTGPCTSAGGKQVTEKPNEENQPHPAPIK